MYSIDQANDVLINGDGIIAVTMKSGNMSFDDPYIMFKRLAKIFVVVIVKNGWVEIEIDHEPHHADANQDNLLLLGNFSIIGDVRISSDMSADVLIISEKFVSRIVPESSVTGRPSLTFPVTNIIAMRDNPLMHLQPEEKTLIHSHFDRVVHNIGRTHAVLRTQLLYVSTVEFLMELMNIIFPKYLGGKPKRAITDRNQYIVEQFSRFLLDNFKREHSVTFYANKLCISAQYLSKATRTVLGISASKVIDNLIISEALIMLRDPNCSMQNIAAELGFLDQSHFGKFFKKHQGMSPLSYRKQL